MTIPSYNSQYEFNSLETTSTAPKHYDFYFFFSVKIKLNSTLAYKELVNGWMNTVDQQGNSLSLSLSL